MNGQVEKSSNLHNNGWPSWIFSIYKFRTCVCVGGVGVCIISVGVCGCVGVCGGVCKQELILIITFARYLK